MQPQPVETIPHLGGVMVRVGKDVGLYDEETGQLINRPTLKEWFAWQRQWMRGR